MPLQRLPSIDLVDDSEPERELLRQSIKSKRRPTKRPLSRTTSVARGVIEISSSEDSDEAPRKIFHPPPAVTKLHDISSGSFASASSARNIGSAQSHDVPPTPNPSTTIASTQPMITEISGINKFSHFSYVAPPKHRSTCSQKKPETVQQPEVQPKPKGPTKKATHRFAGDFSDVQLAKMTKCISCKVKWTAKKTATQKMSHVLTCSAKKAFNDDTIRILIRQELEIAENEEISSAKDSNLDTNAEPETYFEDVLKVVGPKKRGRRQKAKETVQEITTESRKQILDRARLILGSTLPETVVESTGKHLDVASMQPTQDFGRSSLGQRYGGSALAFSTGLSQPMALSSIDVEDHSQSSSESSPEPPPTTQPFGPSKFSRPAGMTSLVQASVVEIVDEDGGSSNTSASTEVLQRLVKDLSPPLTPKMLPSLLASASPIPWHDEIVGLEPSELSMDNAMDDCFLHYDPGVESPGENTVSSSLYPNHDTIISGRPRSPSPTKPASKAKAPAKKAKEPSKRKQKASSPSGKPDEDGWEEELRTKILQNEQLYTRIIQYEPIHFDVFVDLAEIPTPCPSKMRTKLKNFLDKQAVHFYGSEAQQRGSRRRRSRSKTKPKHGC